MSTTWWKANPAFIEIVEVQVEKDSEHSVWIDLGEFSSGKKRLQRCAKSSQWESYFVSRQAAIGFVREHLAAAVNSAQKALDRVNAKLEEFNKRYPLEEQNDGSE